MKHRLILLMLLIIVSTVQANETTTSVTMRFSVEAPEGYASYANTYSRVNWSPDSTMIAISFNIVDDRNIPILDLWQVYRAETGELLYEGEQFIGWYADSNRMLVRDNASSAPKIVNALTGTTIETLEDAGEIFPETLIDNAIFNLDESNRLRVYDVETGTILLTFEDVTELPLVFANNSLFAVNITDTGLLVYDTLDFSLQYSLLDYSAGLRYRQNQQDWSPDSDRLIVIPLDTWHPFFGPRNIWTLGEGVSEPIYNVTGGMIWSPDGTRIVAASDYTKIRIYDSITGELLETIHGNVDAPLHPLQWIDQYLFIIGGDYGLLPPTMLIVWDFERGEFIVSHVVDVAYNYWLEGDELLIFEPWYGLTRFALQTGEIIETIDVEQPFHNLSPNRRWIIRTESPFEEGVPAPIYVYDFEMFELVAILERHTEIIRTLIWSPDSRYFVSVGEPDIVIIWEVLENTIG